MTTSAVFRKSHRGEGGEWQMQPLPVRHDYFGDSCYLFLLSFLQEWNMQGSLATSWQSHWLLGPHGSGSDFWLCFLFPAKFVYLCFFRCGDQKPGKVRQNHFRRTTVNIRALRGQRGLWQPGHHLSFPTRRTMGPTEGLRLMVKCVNISVRISFSFFLCFFSSSFFFLQ